MWKVLDKVGPIVSGAIGFGLGLFTLIFCEVPGSVVKCFPCIILF